MHQALLRSLCPRGLSTAVTFCIQLPPGRLGSEGPNPALHTRPFTSKLQLLLPGPAAQASNCGVGVGSVTLTSPPAHHSRRPKGFASEASLLSRPAATLQGECSWFSRGSSALASSLLPASVSPLPPLVGAAACYFQNKMWLSCPLVKPSHGSSAPLPGLAFAPPAPCWDSPF